MSAASAKAEREIRACLASLEMMLSRAKRLDEEYDRRIRKVDIDSAPAVSALDHSINFSELRALDVLCREAISRALPDHPGFPEQWHVYEGIEFDSPQHVVANLSSKRTLLIHALSLLGIELRTTAYVSAERLRQLRECSDTRFDLTKLIALCEEINVAYNEGLLLTCGALIRAILDHVPPIFRAESFLEVANNYAGGRSFRAAMQSLELSARKIADSILHSQVRSQEALPTAVQIDFRQPLDVLLQEVTRLLKSPIAHS